MADKVTLTPANFVSSQLPSFTFYSDTVILILSHGLCHQALMTVHRDAWVETAQKICACVIGFLLTIKIKGLFDKLHDQSVAVRLGAECGL